MKLFHLSDLHLGKLVHGESMLEEQKEILGKILQMAEEEQPDAVLICGDLYDRPIPSEGAVRLLDSFLTALSEQKLPVLAVSGNHDSAERVAFGSQLLKQGRLYLSPVFQGTVERVRLTDSMGAVNFYLLPFLRPADVRPFFPDETIQSYQEAVQAAIGTISLNPEERNVLLAHQFVTGASVCESEELSVGGLEQVDASLFEAFDYVALGHLHGPQQVKPNLRYCGSPLKYSFSEASQQKSVTVVELGEKGSVQLRFLPLKPRHDLRELRGSCEELTTQLQALAEEREDYLHITLTDEQDVLFAQERLRECYPNLLKLDYDNRRTRMEQEIDGGKEQKKQPEELFESLYQLMNNQPLSEPQRAYLKQRTEEIWGKL